MDLTLAATRDEEASEKYFGAKTISVAQGTSNPVLENYINSRKYGSGRYVGSLVQIDSTRSAQALKFAPVNWLGGDPDDTEAPSTFYFTSFSARWQDFVNYIHQKSAARDKKLAELVKDNPQWTGEQIAKKAPDPVQKYKVIFSSILPGKTLLDIDPASPREFRYTDANGHELGFSSLSSGEQEVIKMLFDVARKEIRHSVIVVDEPELHLHPTLAFKLIETLKSIGNHTNQLILFTHSSDLISTYYSTGDVYFIDSNADGKNQAHRLSDLSNEHRDVASLVGQNLGLFAVGKKLVFVEGEDSSIDRLTYQKVAQLVDPAVKVIPAGSVLNIMTLHSIEEQIRSAIFGIELYMIRDRDGLSDNQVLALEKNGRIKCLKRRHIENYFLDSEVLKLVADRLYLTERNSDLTASNIAENAKRIAEESLGYNICKNARDYLAINHFLKAPAIRAIETMEVQEVKEALVQSVGSNLAELSNALNQENFSAWLDKEETRLRAKLKNGEWVSELQGKYIFAKLCGTVLKEDQLRVRQAYVDVALENNAPILADIKQLFAGL